MTDIGWIHEELKRLWKIEEAAREWVAIRDNHHVTIEGLEGARGFRADQKLRRVLEETKDEIPG